MTAYLSPERREVRHFHVFSGAGGGAIGMNNGRADIGGMQGVPRCVGGIDVLPEAVRNFTDRVGVQGTCMDLFDRDQYRDFHGVEPPKEWREATPDDIRKAAGNERPHIVFTSPPCKGFSGLLSQRKSETARYKALNRLTVRGIFLCMEAWRDDPPEFFLLENVPRIENRGAALLDQIELLLRSYGYAVARTTHDCGEIAALAQSRKRFLLVARHIEKVPPFLYEPPNRPLRSVGSVLSDFPMPGDDAAGALHELPQLQWKTWVRLAFVEAGKDWRSLQGLAVNDDGHLRDYLVVPDYYPGYLGVREWDGSTGAITGRSSVSNGAFAVADPRYRGQQYAQYGVVDWDESMGAITSQRSPGQGRYSVADPRAVVGKRWAGGKYRITPWSGAANTVIAGSTTGEGAFAVADPRPGIQRSSGDHYLTGGHYGVRGWGEQSGAVTSSGRYDNGYWSVADPRIDELPKAGDRLACMIRALDGTWHRPFTTLELAALQGYVQPDEYLEMHGGGHSSWREQIGNMVPPPAAEAIFNVIAETLLLAWSGETFLLDTRQVWVQPLQIAVSIDKPPVVM